MPFLPPDVLVLAGGGIVGEAWMQGVLAGLEDATGVSFAARTESFVGTSAGAIVAARLAGGDALARPGAPTPDAFVALAREGGSGAGGLGRVEELVPDVSGWAPGEDSAPDGGGAPGHEPAPDGGGAPGHEPAPDGGGAPGDEPAPDGEVRAWRAAAAAAGDAVVGAAAGAGDAVVGAAGRLAGGAARAAGRVGWAVTAPLAGAALAAGAPATTRARAQFLARLPAGAHSLAPLRAHVDGFGARFDGRLRIATVDRATGKRVVFGRPGAPAASVADAVCASCCIPWVFDAVTIGDAAYVDGGVWSVTNLDAAPAGQGTQVLCLDPSGALSVPDRRVAALRGGLRVAAELELAGLRRRGATVHHVLPDRSSVAAMGANLMVPSRWPAALVAGHAQGRALAA